MEDDDEFGDLYTDVLGPFSSASVAPQPHQPSPSPTHLHRPIDLNLNLQSQDDDNTLFEAPRVIPAAQTLAPSQSLPPDLPVASDSIPSPDSAPGPMILVSKQEPVHEKEVEFDIEEGGSNGMEDIVSDDPLIPGLTEAVRQEDNNNGIRGGQAEADGARDDWDSDSEDDLQIVLNEDNHDPMAIETGGIMGEDGHERDPLAILADGDANQGAAGQEWGEEGRQVADGEEKEGGEAGKVSGPAGGGIVIAPKIGYSSHGYHPFHSQFKYVRPGAAPMPGATGGGSGGAPGQVPPNMGAMAGRGRGDWRPSGMKAGPHMQKGFHPSFGMPGWGNNMAGRGSGGLEFTLPSHKNIFDVDIDSFEEKPWAYPGVDLSNFFNFGLNEESWKDYCKQLEQHRVETTMQSKIRVYESGRTEQDYDPDLPPELAAATGQVVPAGAADLVKSDGGQNDMTKGAARMRPPISTGRPIPVGENYGERLPSIDTRPPRPRDSDAVIEIVCQDSLDEDSSTGNGVEERAENGVPMEDLRGDLASQAKIAHNDTKYFDGSPDSCKNRKEELAGRTVNFVHNIVREDNGDLPFPVEVEASRSNGPGSRGQSPMDPSENSGNPHDERYRQGRARKKSPCMTPIHGERNNFNNANEEESVDSMGNKSPLLVRDARELSVECKDDVDDELEPADGSPITEKDELINGTHKDENSLNPLKNEKIRPRVEQRKLQELDDDEDSRAARSSENSKARSGSSRDYQKWRDGAEEEVVQGERSSRIGIVKKHLDEHDMNFRRKDLDGRHGIERNRMVSKPGESSYPLRDFDASLSHNLHIKTEGFSRGRESDNPDGTSQRREDVLYDRKNRTDDSRKRDRDDEMNSRNRGKIREGERSDKDEYPPRKQLANGSYVGARHRERDDNSKSRYEAEDDYHNKRRKDEEYLRRVYAEKEDILHGHRDSSGSRRKRERDEILDLCRRDEQLRIRDNFDKHHSARHKDEVWLHKDSVERQRERDGCHRPKQSRDESSSKRGREEGRGIVRSGLGAEDKAWVGHTRGKDENKVSEKEYQLKETIRHSEQVKRRDWNGDESFSRHRGREDLYAREHQFRNDERKSRQDRSSTRGDHPVDASDSQKGHEKKHKENTRKNRESEGGNPIYLVSSKKRKEDSSTHNNEMGLKIDQKNEVHNNSLRRHREDASSDDDHQQSKRGRSKFERWTSPTERDYSMNSKLSASLKFNEVEKINNVASSAFNEIPDGPGQSVEPAENHYPPLSDNTGVGEPEIKDADTRPSEDQHLDTAEKLKKRSERFKLPIPKDKDGLTMNTENEELPSAKDETPADSEIKHERPPRKRRWISN